ncbi:MAG: HAD-IIB family hydrolase [Ruminococcaceae bacterium]|nr:HAD-IIB family hydrolase [Oscillospiraceae bacterium]
MFKLIAFDLDGTLTEHRTKLGEENRSLLDALSEKYKLLMVGAGSCQRINGQMNKYPIDIIGNYGLQYAKFHDGRLVLVRDEVLPCDYESVRARVDGLRKKYGFNDYKGESVEFHLSGSITFPIIGTKAEIQDKLTFDPDKSIRRKIYADVCSTFDEYNVFIGGSSSFDIVPKPYNKYYALDRYCAENILLHSEVLFVGDDYGVGGNDEPVFLSDFNFRKIDGYLNCRELLADLL